MKKLVTLGLLLATVAFTGTVFADGGALQDRELQKLFNLADRAAKATQTAGPGAQATHETPPVLGHRGSAIK